MCIDWMHSSQKISTCSTPTYVVDNTFSCEEDSRAKSHTLLQVLSARSLDTQVP
jgi:hypothetical protein